eukprot:10788574-Lingulodinium_polyedra.AAC.1
MPCPNCHSVLLVRRGGQHIIGPSLPDSLQPMTMNKSGEWKCLGCRSTHRYAYSNRVDPVDAAGQTLTIGVQSCFRNR